MPEVATRRRVLAAAAAALPLLAGCGKGIGGLGTPPSPAPGVAVLRGAISREQLMIARYQAVLTAAPGLSGRLRPLLAQHEDHLAKLRTRLIDPHPATSPPARPQPPRPPGTPPAALAYLRAAERDAASALLGQLTAASPSLAQLLASIAASEATHAMLLGSHRRAT